MAESEALQICSNAMVLIAADSVVSFEDGTNESQVASALYERTVRSALCEQRWTFNTQSFQASKLVAPSDSDYKFKYQLPSPILTIDKLSPSHIQYELYAKRTIHTDYDGELWVDGQYRVDETEMPDYFLEYLEYRLAAKFAWPITSDQSVVTKMRAEAEIFMLKAKSADAKQRKKVGFKRFPLIQVRG